MGVWSRATTVSADENKIEELKTVAQGLVAEANNVPRRNLVLENAAQNEYPLQGVTAYSYKFISRQDGNAYGIAIDSAGTALDLEQLEADEIAAYTQLYGRLDPFLFEWLLTAKASEKVEVAIWLKEDGYQGPERLDPNAENPEEQLTNFFAQVDEQRAAFVSNIVLPVADRLDAAGYEIMIEAYSPLIYSWLTPSEIRSIAEWSEIDRIYLSPLVEPTLQIARQTINAHTVNARGINGAGVRVAVIEVGGRFAASNPYLSGTVQDATYVCSTASAHSTAVAGMVRSTHSTVRGIAPNVWLRVGGSCTGSQSQITNRSTAAADWGATIINLSLGLDTNRVPGTMDRFFDDMIINRYRTIVIAAGNAGGSGCAQGTDGDVWSPALAYNVISVGNFDDKNSVSWTGDTMNPCSSWRDPISASGDREKPEVAGPGTNINSTTTASPWTGGVGSGTSYAAPMVSGGAALLIHRNSSLGIWPEAVKAILMATAVHNVEGATRLSEKDGAGAIVLDRADDVARRLSTKGNWGGVNYTCSTATTLNVTTMALTAGVKTRVVIAWDTDDSYGSYSTRPAADLDLRIRNSSGTLVASSSSFDNTYEIVEFTPSTSGNYTLQVYKYRCSYNPRFLGWAWYKGS